MTTQVNEQPGNEVPASADIFGEPEAPVFDLEKAMLAGPQSEPVGDTAAIEPSSVVAEATAAAAPDEAATPASPTLEERLAALERENAELRGYQQAMQQQQPKEPEPDPAAVRQQQIEQKVQQLMYQYPDLDEKTLRVIADLVHAEVAPLQTVVQGAAPEFMRNAVSGLVSTEFAGMANDVAALVTERMSPVEFDRMDGFSKKAVVDDALDIVIGRKVRAGEYVSKEEVSRLKQQMTPQAPAPTAPPTGAALQVVAPSGQPSYTDHPEFEAMVQESMRFGNSREAAEKITRTALANMAANVARGGK